MSKSKTQTRQLERGLATVGQLASEMAAEIGVGASPARTGVGLVDMRQSSAAMAAMSADNWKGFREMVEGQAGKLASVQVVVGRNGTPLAWSAPVILSTEGTVVPDAPMGNWERFKARVESLKGKRVVLEFVAGLNGVPLCWLVVDEKRTEGEGVRV